MNSFDCRLIGLIPVALCTCLIQLAAMRDELARVKEENQKLREMLNQAISNYNALQMHLTALRQQHDVRCNR